jgi:hypothetical protein
MYYNTNTSFGRQSSSPVGTTPSWDVDAVLGLIHPMRDAYRCTGYAPSMRRRCMNQVASFQEGRAILLRLAKGDVSTAMESPKLDTAAHHTLCYRHKNQVDDVVEEWISLLKEWASQNTKKTKSRSSDSCSHSYKPKSGKSEYAEVKMEDLEHTMESILKSDSEIHQFMRLYFEKLAKREEAEQAAREQKTRVKEEQETREQEDRAEEERLRKEQRKREQEARRKEEQQREERCAQEERARLAKQRREKEAREKAARETQSWTQSWEDYIEAWDDIQSLKSKSVSRPDSPLIIPYPFLATKTNSNLVSSKTAYSLACEIGATIRR